MQRAELRRLARMGAEGRLVALRAEIDSIFRHFPDLRPPAEGTQQRTRSGQQPTLTTPARRRRRRMSAAQRRAVSARMKKYWAGRRRARK